MNLEFVSHLIDFLQLKAFDISLPSSADWEMVFSGMY